MAVVTRSENLDMDEAREGKHLCQLDSCLSGTYFKISSAQPEIYKRTSNTDGTAKYTNTLQERRKQLRGRRSLSKERQRSTCFRGDDAGLCFDMKA